MIKLIKGFLLWIIAISMSAMMADIVISDELAEYIGMNKTSAYIYVGCFVVIFIYLLWYMRKKENKWLDIALPVGILMLWFVLRRDTLCRGFSGMLYSIAEAIKEAYGFVSDLALDNAVTSACVKESFLFVMAILLFLIIFLMERCESIWLAAVFPLLLMVAGASLNIAPGKYTMLLAIAALIFLRYFMIGYHGKTGVIAGAVMISVILVCCMFIAKYFNRPVFDMGMKNQKKLIETANKIVGAANDVNINRNNRKKMQQYDTINGERAELTDDVIDTITLPEKPEGTYYDKQQIFDTYENSTWTYSGKDYLSSPDSYLKFPENGLDMLYTDIRAKQSEREAEKASGDDVGSAIQIVREFVQEHATYTTNPGGYQDGMDSVICFLYDKHKGYCVHFASAAVLSLRALGFPSRYVIGYAIPEYAWQQGADGGYHADILECYGHAWAEVYNIYDDTWIIVETTPGYQTDISDSQIENEVTSEDISAEDVSESTSEEDISEDMQKTTAEATAEEMNTEKYQQTSDEKDASKGNGVSDDSDGIVTIIIVLAIVVFVILICLAVLYARRRMIVIRRRKSFHSRDYKAAIYNMSESIYEMLCFSGLTDRKFSDDVQYIEDIDEKLDFLKEGEFKLFSDMVQAAVYGDVSPGIEDMQRYLKMYRLIRLHLYWNLPFKNRFVWKLIRCYD